MNTRMNYSDNAINKIGSLEGYWSTSGESSIALYTQQLPSTNPDGSEAVKPPIGEIRRHHPEVKRREVGSWLSPDGTARRYLFISRINIPFSDTRHPLPRHIPIQIIFHRAMACKSLMSVKLNGTSEDLGKYSKASVPLINPVLQLTLAQSPYYDKRLAPHKLNNISFPFAEDSIRRMNLDSGQSHFKFKIGDGPLPTQLAFGITKPKYFDGSFTHSITQFKPYQLSQFEIQIDGKPVPEHPLGLNEMNAQEFFWQFNKQCNFWHNPHSFGSLSYEDFLWQNFLICYNLKEKGFNEGQLTVSIKMKQLLEENYLLIILIRRQKALEMDSYYNVNIANLTSKRADKETEKLE